jgi:hypothetical protein
MSKGCCRSGSESIGAEHKHFFKSLNAFFWDRTPHKFLLTTTPGYLVEGPCNMGESQNEPAVEIGKAQEAPKLSECGWGWLVMDDLDLGWIQMYTMYPK